MVAPTVASKAIYSAAMKAASWVIEMAVEKAKQ
jgi:hypothetical protein